MEQQSLMNDAKREEGEEDKGYFVGEEEEEGQEEGEEIEKG